MAGLHTALALTECINNPNCPYANPPSLSSPSPICNMSPVTNIPTKKKRWWIGWLPAKKTSQVTQAVESHHRCSAIKSEIIILDASCIGKRSSGRAKGLVVPGFQVPLENLQENASDASSSAASSSSWTVPSIIQSLSNSPGYTKAVVEECTTCPTEQWIDWRILWVSMRISIFLEAFDIVLGWTIVPWFPLLTGIALMRIIHHRRRRLQHGWENVWRISERQVSCIRSEQRRHIGLCWGLATEWWDAWRETLGYEMKMSWSVSIILDNN